MGLIIVKSAGADAEYFTKTVEIARDIIKNAHFGLVTIKKGICLNVNNQNLNGYFYDLPGLNYVSNDDEAVATFIHLFNHKDNPKIPIPAVFKYGAVGADFSPMGDLFITTSQQYHFYINNKMSCDFHHYLDNIVDNHNYLNLMEHSKFRQAVNYGPGISKTTGCVIGNKDELFIVNKDRFSGHKGIYFSTPFMGDRIVNIIDNKATTKKIDEPKLGTMRNRGVYYRQRREITSRMNEIYFIKKYNTVLSIRNRERFIIISYIANDYNDRFELMSLRTGELIEVKFYDLRNIYSGYYFRKLHNGKN